MVSLWFALAACVDPTDCRFFDDCTLYRPRGLDCGLAHEGISHVGGSCRGDGDAWTDPALEGPSTGVITARSGARDCPEGLTQLRLSDHEASNEHWATCEATGNGAAAHRRLEDLPRGAVCGLSLLNLSPRDCEGFEPVRGECPPGWRWRSAYDYYLDRVDASCSPDACSDALPVPLAEFLVFCELEEGCRDSDCPPGVLDGGWLCGLHSVPVVVNGLVLEPGFTMEIWDDFCPDDPLRLAWRDRLVGTDGPAACLDVDDVAADGCPAGTVEVCTGDFYATAAIYADNVATRALCWCAVEGSAQALAASSADDSPTPDPPATCPTDTGG